MINKELFNSIKTATESGFAIFDERIPKGAESAHDMVYLAIEMHKLDRATDEIEQLQDCIKLMESDEAISAILNKLVGTSLQSARVGDAKSTIKAFIQGMYIEGTHPSSENFEGQYERFEQLFYSDELEFIEFSRLYNFTCKSPEVLLDGETKIKRISDPQVDAASRVEMRGYEGFSHSPFVIERISKKKKLVLRGDEHLDGDEAQKEHQATELAFDRVTMALRLLKSSGTYRDSGITTEMLTFHPSGGKSIRSPFYQNTVIGKKCELDAEEEASLRDIYKSLKANVAKPILIALRRLSIGMERRSAEDSLIDFMIGFEALFLPDGNTELTYKLSLRVAVFISSNNDERVDLFDFMKRMYSIRSKIVHGANYTLTPDDLSKSEELLRESISRLLKADYQAEKQKFDLNILT